MIQRIIAIGIGIVGALCWPWAPDAVATTMTVTTTADELDTNGQCSLREAIRNANSFGRPFPDCPAGTRNDTINLPAGTIQLTIAGRGEDGAATGDLDIDATITIQGQGPLATRIVAGPAAGQGIDRVFDVRPEARFTLRQVGVGNGNPVVGINSSAEDGGGIKVNSNDTELTLEDVHVFDNVARVGGGVLASNGQVTILRTTIVGNIGNRNGGGLFSISGTVTITDSAIRNNTSGANGGGILASGGSMTITDSTIASNLARNLGGGIEVNDNNDSQTLRITGSTISFNRLDPSLGGGTQAFGAGINAARSTTTIVNSTIAGNQIVNATLGEGGGIMAVGGTLTLVHTTIAVNFGRGGRGGGVSVGSQNPNNVARGTIIAGNVDASGAFDNCQGTFFTSVTNLTNSPDGDDDCGFDDAGSIRGQDPRLGPLDSNGGLTQTHALLDGSPAIDRIQAFSIAGRGRICATFQASGEAIFFDQRGSPRGTDGDGNGSARCDIGAFERAGSATGISEFGPTETTVAPGQTIAYTFPWEVPIPKNWHDLDRLELRFREGSRTVFHLRWNDTGDTFQLVHPDGSLGPAFRPGSQETLRTPLASLSLAGTRTQGSGPQGQLVTLTLPITFADATDGLTFTVEAFAAEDSGTSQGFDMVGRVTVARPVGAAPDPNNDKDGKVDKDAPPRLTEEQRQQKERTNRAGLDEYRTEGNTVAARCDLAIPEVDIANRDGLVTLLLLGDTAGQCRSVDPGEYVEADGVKLHEQRYEVDSLTVRNR